MSPGQYALNIALLVYILASNLGTHTVTRRRLLLPVALVAVAGVIFLHDLPTVGNDARLELVGLGAGVLFGLVAGSLVRVRRSGAEVVMSAGAAYAALWILVIGGRMLFAYGADHWFARQIGLFSYHHQITGADAWTAAFVLMALAMVLTRVLVTAVLTVRAPADRTSANRTSANRTSANRAAADDPMITQLDRALTTTARIVAAVPADRWGDPSLCAGWDLRTETNHLVGGLRIFAAQLTGQALDAEHDDHDWLGRTPAGSYDAAARADLEAWSRPDAFDTTFDLAFGQVPAPMALIVHVTEVIVHGADLAVAIGREDLIDQEQAAWLLGLMRELGTDQFRVPGIFGAEVPVAADAEPHRALLGHLGRELASAAVSGQ